MSNWRNVLDKFGKSVNLASDKVGDGIKITLEKVGDLSNKGLDTVGDVFSEIPKFGENLDNAFDKAGDSTKEFFEISGQYINDKLDYFGDKVEKKCSLPTKLSLLSDKDILGLAFPQLIKILDPQWKVLPQYTNDGDEFFAEIYDLPDQSLVM